MNDQPSHKRLYAIGGIDKHTLSSVSQLDSLTNEWTASTPMPFPRKNFGCAVIDRKIYICGGQNDERLMNELTVYDTDTEQWTQLRPMKYAREGCSMAALDGFLYVAGGYNAGMRLEWSQLSVVERYSVETNRWETITPMTHRRSGLELVSMDGYLYAIGGNNGQDWLRRVERYDPQTNKWKTVASLENKYQWFGSAVLNDRIYVTDRYVCEVYHPEENKWHRMAAPRRCYEGVKLSAFNGELLAIGGCWALEGLNRVYRFDFKDKFWTQEADMNVARGRHCVAVVRNI